MFSWENVQPEIVVFRLLGPGYARRDRLELFQQRHDGVRGRGGDERRVDQTRGGGANQHRCGILAAVADVLNLFTLLMYYYYNSKEFFFYRTTLLV